MSLRVLLTKIGEKQKSRFKNKPQFTVLLLSCVLCWPVRMSVVICVTVIGHWLKLVSYVYWLVKLTCQQLQWSLNMTQVNTNVKSKRSMRSIVLVHDKGWMWQWSSCYGIKKQIEPFQIYSSNILFSNFDKKWIFS